MMDLNLFLWINKKDKLQFVEEKRHARKYIQSKWKWNMKAEKKQ